LISSVDDKGFFPLYTPALTVRETVYHDHLDLAKIAEPIAAALTNDELPGLNRKVDVEGKTTSRSPETGSRPRASSVGEPVSAARCNRASPAPGCRGVVMRSAHLSPMFRIRNLAALGRRGWREIGGVFVPDADVP
jgi:hypothetical protein